MTFFNFYHKQNRDFRYKIFIPDKLNSLEELSLWGNKFHIIPKVLGKLPKISKISLDNNPLLLDEEKKMVLYTDLLLEYCRKKLAINVFLSHAVANFDYFNISGIAEFLESKEDINEAFYCQEDLRDHIDVFMNEFIPKSQILIFFASEKSIKSVDCKHELELAKLHNLPILPVIKESITVSDLSTLNFNYQHKVMYNPETQDVCKEVLLFYIQTLKYQREEVEKKNAIIRENIQNTIMNLLDYHMFYDSVENNEKNLLKLFNQFSYGEIDIFQYLIESIKILQMKGYEFEEKDYSIPPTSNFCE
ncbi:MAG: hypothetical protein EU547_04985 [Promethearchaeota archaeon]|nr:MAG: hypothetical protein EU547_04985 [Candidatus Lokiarchaeota archaeon]